MTEFERCRADLREWAVFCQGYEAANIYFNRHVGDRCFSEELEILNACQTPWQLVAYVLTHVPCFAEEKKPMRERWNEFRREAHRRFYRRCIDSEHPVPCNPPCVIERLRWLVSTGG